MQIKDIGGEFALIKQLSHIIPGKSPDLLVGVGDDAAVIQLAGERDDFLIVTADTLVENEHFSFHWSDPEHIGTKAMECNVSDIAAMGGIPKFAFISLVLPEKMDAKIIMRIYEGIAMSCNHHGITVAGGDTTKGALFSISITLMGFVTKSRLCLRSHAKIKDLLCVTGCLGASGAALSLLKKKLPVTEFLLKKHITPTARMDIVDKIASYTHAMIDISDGLSAEVHHICKSSQVGAVVNADRIPIHTDVIGAAEQLKQPPYHYALTGGEDLELLLTISETNFHELKKEGVTLFCIGEITEKEKGITLITPANESVPLQGGFDHFFSAAPIRQEEN